MWKHKVTIAIATIFFVGLSILLYPTVSSFFNAGRQSRVITEYSSALAELGCEIHRELLDAAHEWNRTLAAKVNRFAFTDEEWARYYEMLNATGSGVMGYIEIETIGVRLPIYHGTSERVLEIGVGHLEWSSLPVGGLGTHSALTAHTGLPTADLFNKLDRLTYGDTFVIRVLREELTYKIDQILVVGPSDTSALVIIADMDYSTLITCTPYIVNTHRLLVRGVRVPNAATDMEDFMIIECGCYPMWPLVVWLLILSALVVYLFIRYRSAKRKSYE